jgi:signal transduction histidine kinase/ligand-binding sensor domain-containing protein
VRRFSRFQSVQRKTVLSALVLLFLAVAAQQRHTPAHLGVNEGLSQGSAFDLEQDDNGFIWIATADGLNRFDGHNFEVFNSHLVDSFPFPLTRLRNVFHTKDALWVTSSQSMVLSRIDLVSGKAETVYDFPERSGYGDACPFHLSGDTLWNLVINKGVVAVSVSQHKILQEFPEAHNPFPANSMCRYDSARKTIWYTNIRYTELCSFSIGDKTFKHRAFLKPESNDTLTVCAVTKRSDGSLRIGSKNSVIAYYPETGATVIHPLPAAEGTSGTVTAVLAEKENITWCGTNEGMVYRLDEAAGTTELVSSPEEMNGVGHRIISFLMDRSENLWIGTDPMGLMRIDTKQKPFNHTYHDPKSEGGLRSNFMKCFEQLGDEMLIATYDQGINVLNTRTGTYRYITGPGKVPPVIYQMATDSAGRVWSCTTQGVLVAEPGASTLTRPVLEGNDPLLLRSSKAIYRMNNGTLLVGLFDSMFAIRPNGNAYAMERVNLRANVECFYTDRQGRLWMGSSHGVYLSTSGSPHDLEPFIANTGLVKSLYQSADDDLMWAATDHGLCVIDVKQQAVTKTYTEKDGMPNSFVYGILGDDAGNLWLSTNKGLTRFNMQSQTFRNYSVADGLQSNEFNTNAFYKTTAGEFYFGGVNGYNHFYPAEIKDNAYVPACVITGFRIFDKPFETDSAIEYKRHITVDYTNNNLLLEYAGLEFSDPAGNTFSYRMLGLDTNWVQAGHARFARFVNLDPGDYTFQLKAANSDGVWSSVARELRITITPPFWQTAWFIISVSVITLLLVVIAIRLYFRRQLNLKTRELQLKQGARMSAIIETEEKERKRVAEELHDGLGQLLSTARLNISGIGSDLQEKDATLWKNSLDLLDEACSEVRAISHNMMPGALIRSGLIEALDDLVEKINATGKLEARFDTELNERFPETVEVTVYRITQEVLNNMIRHADASRIVITLHRTATDLALTIADNGKSFDVTSIPGSEGIGWKNIYSRVEMLNGNLQVTSEKEKGTAVFLSVPLQLTND